MPNLANTILAALTARFAALRFPTLTVIAAILFVLDLVIPDVIPLADEILLGLLTAALASWKSSRRGPRATSSRGSGPEPSAPPRG